MGIQHFTLEGRPGLRMRSTSVDRVQCEGQKASIEGEAILGSGEKARYRIDLEDRPAFQRDRYRIQLGSRYDSGLQSLRSGDVHVRSR